MFLDNAVEFILDQQKKYENGMVFSNKKSLFTNMRDNRKLHCVLAGRVSIYLSDQGELLCTACGFFVVYTHVL